MKKKYTFMSIIPRLIPMQFMASPKMNGLQLIVNMSLALLLAINVILTQRLFDAISLAAAGVADFWTCVSPLIIMALVAIGHQFIYGLNFILWGYLSGKTVGRLRTLLQQKIQRIFPVQFEDTVFLDDLNKANEGLMTVNYICLVTYALLVYHSLYFVIISSYLFRLQPMLLLTLAMAFVPALFSLIARMRVFNKLEEHSAPLRREYEYYQKTLCDREYFKETRILGAFKFFHLLFSDTLRLLTHKQWQAERKTSLVQLALNLTTFAGMGSSTYLLFSATMAGDISVGAFAAVYAALNTIFMIMNEVFYLHLSNFSREIGKVANFIRVLDTHERTGAEGTPDFSKGISADNINFTYPGRDEPAVKKVSLTIAEGETIAIVGENGAGKSTLVRLLTGIYLPSEGKVSVGGLDTVSTMPAFLYQHTSGVFQKYQRYKMTLDENVAISDTRDGITREPIISRVETVLKQADAKLNVPLDTMLSPEYDGIDLSGGQWQRVAIARGLYRSNGFIVLDEPTSAIDPIEETRIYKQFQQLSEGKCGILVTHRLGSAKLAHRIIVMDAGEIIDIGTHEELLARSGRYAEMWKAQAQWYERNHWKREMER